MEWILTIIQPPAPRFLREYGHQNHSIRRNWVVQAAMRKNSGRAETLQANAAEEAGKLIQDLPKLWAGATMPERRKLVLAMLDGVYVDAKEDKRIVAIKPKPPFRPVFQVATTKEGSGIQIMKEPPADTPGASCLWWRRGRVELPVQKKLTQSQLQA